MPYSNETVQGALDSPETLAQRFGRQVFQSAYRVLGDRAQAEDVQQEVFLQLLQGAASGVMPVVQSWQAYLCAAASRRAIDVLRKRNRWWQISNWWSAENLDESAPAGLHGPEQSAESKQQSQRLRAALGKLPEREAQCFVLRYLDGMEITEVSTALGINTNAVNVSLHRARTRLNEVLAKQIDSDAQSKRSPR